MNIECTFETSDGFTIAGMHTRSKGGGLVLWLHGLAVNKDEYLGFYRDGADFLASKGIDSLRFDFRGHGESSGTSLDFSVSGQDRDVDAAVRYLAECYSLDLEPMTVIGTSFGAPPAIFAATRYPSSIKNLVLIAPVLSYRRTFLDPETDWARGIFNERSFAQLRKMGKLKVDDDFYISEHLVRELQTNDPELALEDLHQDVVLIHGDSDSMVPYSVSYDYAAHHDDIELVSMAGMDHGFVDCKDETGASDASSKNKQAMFNIILDSVRK